MDCRSNAGASIVVTNVGTTIITTNITTIITTNITTFDASTGPTIAVIIDSVINGLTSSINLIPIAN